MMDTSEFKQRFETYKKDGIKAVYDRGKILPKYDEGTDDKTYLPEYEYEATVTPQGTSVEKHKRITNEEDWLNYWGNVGAGYVNKALESVAKPVLEGLKNASYFTPIGNATAFGDFLAAIINGDKDELLASGAGLLPQVRWARNAYKAGKQLMSLNHLWDRHYIHALNDKDLRGAKNLRDAHFIVNAPNTKIKNGDLPVTLYHGTPNKGWNEYDPNFFGSNTDDGYYGKGLYLTETLDDALAYAGIKDRNFEKFTGTKNPYLKRLYVNSETPFVSGALNNDFKIATANEASDRAMLAPHFGRDLKFKIGTPGSESGTVYIPNDMIYDPTLVRELENADASIFSNVLHHVDRDPTIVKFDEVIVPKSSLMKYVDPITYDDFGNVIPLSMRDNFSNPDFRFDKGKSLKKSDYTVKRGDSPWRISHNAGMTLDRFYELNPWTNIEKGGIIHPNDKVIIEVPDNRPTTYIPRMSKELLEGVTVTAKRKSVRPKLNVSAQLSTAKSVGSNSNHRQEYKLPQWQTVEQPEVFKSKELLNNIFKTLQKQVKPKQAAQKLQPVVKKTPKIDNQQLAEYQLPLWLSLEQPSAFKTMQELEQAYGNAPRQIKPKTSSDEVKKASNAQYSQKAYPLTPEITRDGFRSAAYGARDVARSVASLLPDSDFKQDVMGVLDKDKSLTASYIELKNGLELRARQYADELMSVFDSDNSLQNTGYDLPLQIRNQLLQNGKYQLEDLPVNGNNKLKLRDIIANKPIENVVSDTTSVVRNPEDRKFKATRIINMDTTPVGFRNRFHEYDENGKGVGGENYDPVKDTQGVIINTYTPLLRYGHQMLQKEDADFGYGKRHWNYYIGVTDDGKFVHGSDYTKLPQNASYARTMAHKITHLSDNGLGKSPQMHFENGKSSPINFTSSTRSIDKTHRGGGLISAGGETIHLEGSLKHMNEQIERLKRRHNVDSVLYIEEDNGSYSERLSTKDHEITSKDWLYYMHQNVSPANGNSIYIKGLPNLGRSIKPVKKRK